MFKFLLQRTFVIMKHYYLGFFMAIAKELEL
jgi:hypothetical protein